MDDTRRRFAPGEANSKEVPARRKLCRRARRKTNAAAFQRRTGKEEPARRELD